MKRIFFVRHGPTAFTAQRRRHGRADIPLSAGAYEASHQVAQALAPFHSILEHASHWTSPALRACDTASLVRSALPIKLPFLIMDARLRERCWGEWEGLSNDEIKARDANLYERYRQDPFAIAPPKGETGRELVQRLSVWLAHIEGDALVFSHQAVGRALIQLAVGWPALKAWRFEIDCQTPLIISPHGVALLNACGGAMRKHGDFALIEGVQ